MNAIRATWTNGQILPSEPVSWPEGSQLLVEPVHSNGDDVVPGDNIWGDGPESIETWAAAVEKIEPMIWAEGEREEFDAYREKVRQYTLEAVRKRMEEPSGNATP
jgi:hypothetical protein